MIATLKKNEQPIEKVKGITVINEEDNGQTLIYGTKNRETRFSLKGYSVEELNDELKIETKKRDKAIAETQQLEIDLIRTPIGEQYQAIKNAISDNKRIIEIAKITIPFIEKNIAKQPTEKQSSGNKLTEQAEAEKKAVR